jgi:hypothetical protein
MKTTMTKAKPTITERRNNMRGIVQTAGMPKKKMVICLMAVLFTCLWAGTSFASWSQWINENGIYNGTTYQITKIEVFKLDGTSGLENPGMSNFTAGTWTVQMPNANYVVATNPGVSNFDWLFSFTGNSSSSVHLAYLAYTSTNQVFGSYLNFNYAGTSNWSFPEIQNFNPATYNSYRRDASSVPIPPAVLLFGTGLISLAGLRKKLKN